MVIICYISKKLGALSQRRVNPVDPCYEEPGATQELRPDHAFAEPWKEAPVKKSGNRMKPEWKKSTVIPIIEDRKVSNQSDQGVDPLIAAANVQ
jgi:hypothetical protein